MTTTRGQRRVRAVARGRIRSIAAGGLVVINLFLVVLNLDKHSSLPVSTGVFGSEQTTDAQLHVE